MTNKKAAEILIAYNLWRRGDHKPCNFDYSAQELGVAIEMATFALLRIDNTDNTEEDE